MAKGGSKLIVGLISFLLGFLFALLAEIGAIAGIYFYVTSQDIDSLLEAVGLPNRDEDGNNIYINTDPENGGAKTIRDLITCLQELLYDDGQLSILSKSFNDFEELLPATNILLNMLYDAVGDFITIDSEKFESVPLTDVAQVLADSVMNVHVGSLLDKIGGSSITETNVIIRSLLLGAETEYASVVSQTYSSDVKLPVLYDIYTKDVDDDFLGWSRVIKETEPYEGSPAFHGNLYGDDVSEQDKYIELTTVNDRPDGALTYRTGKLCYVPCRVTEEGIFPAEYDLVNYNYTAKNGDTYAFQYLDYAADTDFITVQANKDGNYILDYDAIWGALNPDPTQRANMSYRFEGYSYFTEYGRSYYYIEDDGANRPDLKTISGKNFFRNGENNLVQLDPLTLGDLIYNAFGPLYSITITEVVGDNGSVAGDIFGKTTLGDLLDGNVNLDNIIKDLQLSTLMTDVTPDNALMAYIVFKLTDIKEEGDVWTAVYDKGGDNQRNVTVKVENGHIVAAYYGDVKLDGVKVSEVADIVSGLTGVLTIGDVIEVGDNKILQALADCTLGGIEEKIGSIKLGDLIDVEGNKLLEALADTTLDGIGERMDNLTVGELFDDSDMEKSTILRQLKDVKIMHLSDEINELSIQRIYAKDIYGEAGNGDPALATEYNEKYVYYYRDGGEDGQGGVYRLAGDEGHLTAEQFADGEYYTYGKITNAMWELILCDDSGVEIVYYVEEFDEVISASKGRIYNATIYTLIDAGIIDSIKKDDSSLEKTLPGMSNKLGESTLADVIEYVLGVAAATGA